GGEDDHTSSGAEQISRDCGPRLRARKIVEGTREDDRVEDTGPKRRVHHVRSNQVALVSCALQHLAGQVDPDGGGEVSRREAGPHADIENSQTVDLGSYPLQPSSLVDSRVDPVVPGGDVVEEPERLRGPLHDRHGRLHGAPRFEGACESAKTISTPGRWRRERAWRGTPRTFRISGR